MEISSSSKSSRWGGPRANSGGPRANAGGARPNSGGARPNSGGARPGAGRKAVIAIADELGLPASSFAPGNRWYCAEAMHGLEKVAARLLHKQGFVVFLPEHCLTMPGGVQRIRPLFVGYLFVRLDLTRDRWQPVCTTLGVRRIMSTAEDGRPTPLPVGEIERMIFTARASQGAVVSELAFPLIDVGTLCAVLDGPFADLKGVCDLSVDDRVELLFDLFNGRRQRIPFPRQLVAPVAEIAAAEAG